jgi:hypothetical protein
VYVAGLTLGTFPGQPGGTGQDIFLARLDPVSGTVTWVRQFGIRGRNASPAFGGIAAADTGVYVATTASALDGVALVSHLRKFDFVGNALWARQFPGVSSCAEVLSGVATHGTDVYVVAQAFEDYFETEDPASCNPGVFGGDPIVGALGKYDANGNLIWKRKIKGGPKDNNGQDHFTGAKRVSASETGVYVSANLSTRFAGSPPNEPKSDRSACESSKPPFKEPREQRHGESNCIGRSRWSLLPFQIGQLLPQEQILSGERTSGTKPGPKHRQHV